MRVHDQKATRMQNVQYGRKRETGPKREKKKPSRQKAQRRHIYTGTGIYSPETFTQKEAPCPVPCGRAGGGIPLRSGPLSRVKS